MCTNGDPLQALTRLVDTLVDADPALLVGRDAIAALHRQLDRLEAVATRATRAFERDRGWEADGARTASAWLAVACSLPQGVARRRVRLGRALGDLPLAERAWLAGDVGATAVGLLASARTEHTAAALERDERALVASATRLDLRGFATALAYWRQAADPDGAEDQAAALHAGRRVHLSSSFEGRWFLDGVLDPVGGEIVAGALARIEEELFRADGAGAGPAPREHERLAGLARTPAQRRADALVELARRAGATAAGDRAPRPLFTVHVGYETFEGRICELARGTVVTPGTLVPWLAEADVERVVFDGGDRVLGVGRRRRFFTGAERRAVEVRDRRCTSRYCDLPAEHCEVDHVVPWARGGPTVAENGQLACGYHNRHRADAGSVPGERGPPG